MNPRNVLPILLIICGIFAPIASATQDATPPRSEPTKAAKNTNAATQVASPENEGERIFQQNCSRCHAAPEGFSPRISGTVVRHMRVRASLSKHDEQELLRFFNP